eukprot:10274114-Karenia_brevis.AAC.1
MSLAELNFLISGRAYQQISKLNYAARVAAPVDPVAIPWWFAHFLAWHNGKHRFASKSRPRFFQL